MNEKTKKWLSFKEKNIAPTRYKTKSVIYSTKAISKLVEFSLKKYQIKLYPFKEGESSFKIDRSEKYPPAFICEVIADTSVHQDGENFDIPLALDIVLGTSMKINYPISKYYQVINSVL